MSNERYLAKRERKLSRLRSLKNVRSGNAIRGSPQQEHEEDEGDEEKEEEYPEDKEENDSGGGPGAEPNQKELDEIG